MKNNIKDMNKKGFTIVEIVVAAFLLLTLLSVSTPLLYQLMRYQRNSNNADDLNDNIQYVLMILEKELATGSNIQKITDGIEFTNQEGEDVKYEITGDDNNILKKTVASTSTDINNPSEFLITGINLVDNQLLDLDGDTVAETSGMRHLVTVFLQAESVLGQDGSKTELPIQMSIIPRNQNLNN